MVGRSGAPALAGLLALTGCADGGAACTAVGWNNAVVVEFAEGWRAVEGGVTVECDPACYTDVLVDPEAATVDPADGESATGLLGMSTPGSIVVRVIGADGARLTEVDADLDWRRVGGTEECGGPHEATVVVPAP
ncbi:hypothetical protein DQ237_18235 [Blastococcus sp. TF02-8]|uniref:hypothetical protein n=1 Tax=Blastococcus sp. TF02-8 TaxID=2250574 RepID=UPI000DEBC51C|nr:hypothetical protein [Blastococcus sp. TF02-8]RBY93388.1 hypothetical protein DQ237_18235 [Blastococcus sp. TF02-8]